MRVLVDTCVIIDALQSRVPFAEAAQKLFIYSANMQFEGYITAKSITDIYYLTHRLTHSDAETRKILSKLFTLFHLLDTTSLDCRKAISSEISEYEDAVIKTVGYSEETRGNIILPKFKHNYLPDVEKVQKVFDWATAKGLLTKDITAKDVLNNVATK